MKIKEFNTITEFPLHIIVREETIPSTDKIVFVVGKDINGGGFRDVKNKFIAYKKCEKIKLLPTATVEFHNGDYKPELPTIEQCVKGVREICAKQNFSEDELRHRARFIYLMARLDFWNEFPILLEEITYQRKKHVK